MKARSWLIIAFCGGLGIGAIFVGWGLGAGPAEEARLAARYTARVGFPIFLTVYLASSLFRFWPGEITRTLVRDRRYWGLGFALAHTIHLGALLNHFRVSGGEPAIISVLAGGKAYVSMFLMALTSNNTSMKILGKGWKVLHQVGIHALWIIFAYTYFERIFEPGFRAQGVVFFILTMVALGFRTISWLRPRR